MKPTRMRLSEGSGLSGVDALVLQLNRGRADRFKRNLVRSTIRIIMYYHVNVQVGAISLNLTSTISGLKFHLRSEGAA